MPQIIKKQILYRSAHRGCKETDFLLGNFFEAKLNSFTASDLALSRNFLEEDDVKIYDWILDKEQAPKAYLALIEEIRKFHNI